jgi:hypothetical protein
MVTTERDDASDELPEVDPLAGSILPMVESIFAATHEDSPERAAAMRELMSSVERIRSAMRPRSRLN